jgi:hypothetical protein
MKKFLALIFFTLVTIVTFAQSNSKLENKEIARISYVVKSGLNLSNMLVKDDENTYSTNCKWKSGFHLGITAEFPITETVVFETGLLLSTKGFKFNVTDTLYDEPPGYGYEYGEAYQSQGKICDSKRSLNLLYLVIPLTAKTYFNVGRTRLFGALGPYIGYGLSGKSKSKNTINGQTESQEVDVNWGSGDNDDAKRLDFGLSADIGMEIRTIQIGLSYNLGLANISADTFFGQKINNRALGLSIGYKFKSK